jgi:pimeloyl-ACP methyl ester carboxylesterase
VSRLRRAARIAGLAIALLLAGGVAASWAPDLPLEALTPRYAPPPSRFVVADGLSLHVRDEGPRDDPSPLVLLHGTSASLHTFDAWVSALSGTHRVIRLDLPGFGLTGPYADGDYGMAHYLRTLAALLDTLGVQRAVLIGNSFGGNLAWHAAAAWPARVAKLVLIDASGYALPAQSVPIGFKLARMAWLRPLTERLLPPGTIEGSLRNVYGHPERVTPELVTRYRELTLRAGNRGAVVERFQQVVPGQDVEQIPSIRAPTLIVWGSEDRLIPLASGQRFAREIPGSELVVLPGLGHVPHEEAPEVALAPVRAFLARSP